VTFIKKNSAFGRTRTILLAALAILSMPLAAGAQAAKPATYDQAEAAVARENNLLRTMTMQYNNGQYVLAGHTGKEILAVDPTNLTAHYLMGNIFLKADLYDNAADEYEYCARHGLGTRIGDYARAALAKLKGNPVVGAPNVSPPASAANAGASVGQTFNNPAQPPPARVDRQSAEYRDNALKSAAVAIDNKRRTLEGTTARLNQEAQAEIDAVPKYVFNGKHQVRNPNYDSDVQAIKDDLAGRLKILQVDFQNEQDKLNLFYRNLANSYDNAGASVRSQAEDNRAHRVIDTNPDMFVHNYGAGKPRASDTTSGVTRSVQGQLEPTTPQTPAQH
jgi:tetratricopeptide (TPR) repeat protein